MLLRSVEEFVRIGNSRLFLTLGLYSETVRKVKEKRETAVLVELSCGRLQIFYHGGLNSNGVAQMPFFQQKRLKNISSPNCCPSQIRG